MLKYILALIFVFLSSLLYGQVLEFEKTIQHAYGGYLPSYSANGKYILSTKSGRLQVWDVEKDSILFETSKKKGISIIQNASFSPDGRFVVTASWDKTVKLFAVPSGTLLGTYMGHSGAVFTANFSPDGRFIVTASRDGTAQVWDVSTKQSVDTFFAGGEANSAFFSADGKRVLIASDYNVATIWGTSATNTQITLKGHKGGVTWASFSPDDQYIVTASYDSNARIWNGRTGDSIMTLRGHRNSLQYASYSPNGELILTVSMDSTAKLWDAKTGHLVDSIEGPFDIVKTAFFSPDGKYLIVNYSDNTSKKWRVLNGGKVKTNSGRPKREFNEIVTSQPTVNGYSVPLNTGRALNRANSEARGVDLSNNQLSNRELLPSFNLALVIGTNVYRNWKQLENPIFDAGAIRNALKENYNYQVVYLENPTREIIYQKMDSISTYLSTQNEVNTNLLVFIAGHGGYDNLVRGYIVPSDAASPSDDKYKTTYINHSQLRDMIDNIPAKHTLVMLDVCYGGTFDQLISYSGHRGADDVEYEEIDFQELVLRKQPYKSRLYITSGGREYVPDGRPGKHSPFAYKLIDLLLESTANHKPITFHKICDKLELLKPEPRAGQFGNDNEPGGDFILVPNSLSKK